MDGINSKSSFERFSIVKTILLVLCAGMSITIPYILISLTGVFESYPNIVILSIAALIGTLGFQIGYILFDTKKQYGNFDISKTLGLRNKLGWKKLVVWVPALLVSCVALFMGTSFIGIWLQEKFFYWLPNWYPLQADYSNYSTRVQVTTYIVIFVCIAILVPIIEEIFFRGFLMPRMAWMGKWMVLVNVVLFASYHFWSPWQMVTRIIAMYPVYYFAHKKQSLTLAILVHCIANLLGDVVGPVLASL